MINLECNDDLREAINILIKKNLINGDIENFNTINKGNEVEIRYTDGWDNKEKEKFKKAIGHLVKITPCFGKNSSGYDHINLIAKKQKVKSANISYPVIIAFLFLFFLLYLSNE